MATGRLAAVSQYIGPALGDIFTYPREVVPSLRFLILVLFGAFAAQPLLRAVFNPKRVCFDLSLFRALPLSPYRRASVRGWSCISTGPEGTFAGLDLAERGLEGAARSA